MSTNSQSQSRERGLSASAEPSRAGHLPLPAGVQPFQAKLTKEAINELPLFHYEGSVTLVSTSEEACAAVARLSVETILGFDTETPPCFRKGKSRPPALVQLAGSKEVVLFPLKLCPLGPELIALFENPAIIKTGVAVHDDMRFLSKLEPFAACSVVDLSAVAQHNNVQNRGLRGLVAAFLGLRISKGEQCSNWGSAELSARQIRYAATDAWASREVYLRMTEAGLDVSLPLKPAAGRKPKLPKRSYSYRTL
ncbi:3'-5' exonuclease domain-containing protein 2 [Desulfovibrio sp. OttesenSCG-928-G15]|nr:3'-5' exonuclease domain-containing protein 2 [Desulfovibrio sp. OttesenSCG-928-G15]